MARLIFCTGVFFFCTEVFFLHRSHFFLRTTVNQILILNIHHCSEEAIFLVELSLSLLYIRKSIIVSYKYIYPFGCILLRSRNFELFYWIFSLLLGVWVIKSSIDSSNPFRFTNIFLNILFWSLLCYQFEVNQKYYVW